MVAERSVAHLVIGNREREHRQAGIHDFAHDPVLGLLVEPRVRVHHAGVEAVIALFDAGVRGRVGQAGAGDAQPAYGNRTDAAWKHEPSAGLVVVVLADERCPVAESVSQPCIDLRCLDDVRITRVVPHRSPLRPLVRWRASSTPRGQQYQRPRLSSRGHAMRSMRRGARADAHASTQPCSSARVVQSCRHACIGSAIPDGPGGRRCRRRSRTGRRSRWCIGHRRHRVRRGVVPRPAAEPRSLPVSARSAVPAGDRGRGCGAYGT